MKLTITELLYLLKREQKRMQTTTYHEAPMLCDAFISRGTGDTPEDNDQIIKIRYLNGSEQIIQLKDIEP